MTRNIWPPAQAANAWNYWATTAEQGRDVDSKLAYYYGTHQHFYTFQYYGLQLLCMQSQSNASNQ